MTNPTAYDVIVAGAGPVGLFLACELKLAGASVLVLERTPGDAPVSPWKSEPLGLRGMTTPSVETLYRRNLLGGDVVFTGGQKRQEEETDSAVTMPTETTTTATTATPVRPRFGGHFAGILFDANKLELGRWKYRIPGPSLEPRPTTLARLEVALVARAESLGIPILRGHEVTGITEQDDSGVTVEAAVSGTSNPSLFRGKWLVGCDGGRSAVRRAAGFGWEGTEARFTGYALKCELDHPEKLKVGFHVTGTGMYITGLLVSGSMFLIDFDDAQFDRRSEITREHLNQVMARVTGVPDVHIKALHFASSFTDRSKLATSYRRGRVLLAGDAAHIHPPFGGQGLNVGLGDAANLGWKLAAAVRLENQETAFSLLASYEAERRPIASWVLDWTRAQVAAMQPDAYGTAIRELVADLVDTTDGANLFMGRSWGLSQRYDPGDGHHHPLVGRSAPDLLLRDGSRLGSKMLGGRALLVDLVGHAALGKLVGDKYAARVDYVDIGADDTRDLGALLIRPDGVVAWATEDDDELDVDGLKVVLDQWFGF